MSLKNALSTKSTKIEVYQGILTISDNIESGFPSVLYASFCADIPIYHPIFGKGEIVSFNNHKWQVDFITASSLQEFNTKTLLNYLPSN